MTDGPERRCHRQPLRKWAALPCYWNHWTSKAGRALYPIHKRDGGGVGLSGSFWCRAPLLPRKGGFPTPASEPPYITLIQIEYARNSRERRFATSESTQTSMSQVCLSGLEAAAYSRSARCATTQEKRGLKFAFAL